MGFFDSVSSFVGGASSTLDTVSNLTGQVQNLTNAFNGSGGGSGGFAVPSIDWGSVIQGNGWAGPTPATSTVFGPALPPEPFGPPLPPRAGISSGVVILGVAALAFFALKR